MTIRVVRSSSSRSVPTKRYESTAGSGGSALSSAAGMVSTGRPSGYRSLTRGSCPPGATSVRAALIAAPSGPFTCAVIVCRKSAATLPEKMTPR